ncbi:hypothetical protein, partial [Pedobacter sp.]|uniref:hypothetical protein n=1 Tax=Pedobacter sp. TaxID=1411316 RepID=UPI003C54286D
VDKNANNPVHISPRRTIQTLEIYRNMKASNAKPQSENHFIKEWNGTEFNLSIPAKITHSNKPFIYFYWPNPDNYATIERARKGGIGGIKDTRISIKKKAVVIK